MVAIDHGQADIVRLLVGAGAYVGTWTQQGCCEVSIAMRSPEILGILLANGADPNLPHPRFPFMTPLLLCMMANPRPAPQSIKALVRHGANVNARNDAGQTALMLSVYDARLTRALLESGADPRLADRDGETVLDYAAHRQADPATRLVLREWGV